MGKKDGDDKEKIDLNEGKSGKKDKKKEKKEEKKPPVKKEFKPIVETIKEPLEFKLDLVDFADLSSDQYVGSKKKLKDLDDRDEAKAAQEREKIMSKCNEISDWIDEEATFETPVETLESKQKEITDLTAAMHARVKQHNDRPEALE